MKLDLMTFFGFVRKLLISHVSSCVSSVCFRSNIYKHAIFTLLGDMQSIRGYFVLENFRRKVSADTLHVFLIDLRADFVTFCLVDDFPGGFLLYAWVILNGPLWLLDLLRLGHNVIEAEIPFYFSLGRTLSPSHSNGKRCSSPTSPHGFSSLVV